MASTEVQKDPTDPQAPMKSPVRPHKDVPLADVQDEGKTAVADQDEHEGATEEQVGDRGGPGVGFDQEPEREKDEGGVS